MTILFYSMERSGILKTERDQYYLFKLFYACGFIFFCIFGIINFFNALIDYLW